MGLDMYLNAERFYWTDEVKPTIAEVPKGYEVKTITVEAAYWRKVNAVHQWFVDNVQDGEDDCQDYHVEADKLKELNDLCYRILQAKGKARDKLATELLPPASGFFFGGAELDEWYYEGLKDTINQLSKALSAFSTESYRDWSFTYHSSW